MNRGNILPTGLVMILLFSPLLTTTIAAPLTVSRLQANQGATVDSWPTFHHDASRSGFASGAAPHSPLVLWSFGTHGSIESSPVIENGVVYISSEDGYTYALN